MPKPSRQSARVTEGGSKRKREMGTASSEAYELSSDQPSGEDELASDSVYSDARQKSRKGKGKAVPAKGYISDKVLVDHRSVSLSPQ